MLLLAPAQCRAVRWLWNSIPDRWADKPVKIDGKDSDWYTDEEYDDAGLSLRAMSDASNLYLLIMADGRDGRALLSGAFRQDLTIWFLGPDHKSRAWGIRSAFSTLGPPDRGTLDEIELGEAPTVPDIDPELVLAHGAAVSTAAWTRDIELKVGVSGKNPIYELRIPLSKFGAGGARSIPLDLVASKIDPEIAKQIQAAGGQRSAHKKSSESDSPGGDHPGHGGHGGRGKQGGDSEKSDEGLVPEALNLQLRLRLAKSPDQR